MLESPEVVDIEFPGHDYSKTRDLVDAQEEFLADATDGMVRRYPSQSGKMRGTLKRMQCACHDPVASIYSATRNQVAYSSL
jgi:hypothetical protein